MFIYSIYMNIQIFLLILLSIKDVHSHSVSWGYSYNCSLGCYGGGVDVTIWSGSYHNASYFIYPPMTVNEGYLQYTPTDSTGSLGIGPSTSKLFDMLSIGKRPSGLIDGKTHFYGDMSITGKIYGNDNALKLTYASGRVTAVPVSWQGTRVHLTPGYYRIYYDTALSSFDQVFMPIPGILYGIIMYVGCHNCTAGTYAVGISKSLAPTKYPTSTPTMRPTSTLISIHVVFIFIMNVCKIRRSLLHSLRRRVHRRRIPQILQQVSFLYALTSRKKHKLCFVNIMLPFIDH